MSDDSLETLRHKRGYPEQVLALPDALVRALNAYRDRCWRGGDPTPERLCVEQEIANYVNGMISTALDRAIPEVVSDDEVARFLAEEIQIHDEGAAHYALEKSSAIDSRQWSEFHAKEARVLRTIRERLYGKVAA